MTRTAEPERDRANPRACTGGVSLTDTILLPSTFWPVDDAFSVLTMAITADGPGTPTRV